jgi:glycosyltransferase involved in cell wall biosynthesis
LLAYLRNKYSVDVADFKLRPHSKTTAARIWRNTKRLVRGVPPLFDRYSGYESQLEALVGQVSDLPAYSLAVVEHFWCASYAPLLRQHCRSLILDLHNIESALARTHASAARWPASWASRRFAGSYRRLESEWIPKFDTILVASEADRERVDHPQVIVYPNALPEILEPNVAQENCIVFSGNLEYHPNIEAVRWFRARVWPLVREQCPDAEWRLIGRNPEAVARLVAGDDRIRVAGSVDDAVTELARAKVCVVPLLSGSGTRFKILEAWAAARAVVSTAIGAEGLNARASEHLLIADDPDSFAAAVAQLWNDATLRERLGTAGRGFYWENFTWAAAWCKLEEAGI